MVLNFPICRLDSKVSVDYYNNGDKSNNIDLASNYLMLGANRYLLINPRLEPYFGLQMGMGIYNADNHDYKYFRKCYQICLGY